MIKKFEIKDILNAVNTISKKEGKRTKKVEKHDPRKHEAGTEI